MTVDQILQQHGRILLAVESLERLVAGPRPARADQLAGGRWAFTREMYLHCARMESTVLAPLSVDVRPEAARRAAAASQVMDRFIATFRAHVEKWHGLPGEEQWPVYRIAIERLTGTIRDLIECEARQIVTLLPVQPSGRPVPKPRDRYASDAWTIRGRIYAADQTPIE